jgi:hypothetical protein
MMVVSGTSRLLSDGFCIRAHRRCRVIEEGLHLEGEVNTLDRQVKRFRKHILSFEEPSISHPCNL